jgi:NADPH:quinone reductase
MASHVNRQWLLESYPRGMASENNFRLVESSVPDPKRGQILVRTLYLSVDPYMRGRMNREGSYAEPAKLNEVMIGATVGQVVQSKNDRFKEGDFVLAYHGWQDYGLSDGGDLSSLDLAPELLPAALGALGMPGITAWYGMLEIGQPKSGQTVVISGAAGAVGSVAGQIAKMKGCRVVGLAGSEQKVRWLRDTLGFDAAVNYKATDNLKDALARACGRGVDIYFDNVGGRVTDSVLSLLNVRARIVVCGQISMYNLESPEPAAPILPVLLVRRASAKGFIISDHMDRFPEAFSQLREWVEKRRLKHEETITEGLENAPRAFLGLFEGKNMGKQVVKVSDPQHM